jgi:hypothetical protein
MELGEAEGSGLLVVTSLVAGAQVIIDGVRAGIVPVERRVSSGGHQVEVRSEGYSPFRSEVTVSPGQRRLVSIELEPETSGGVFTTWWFWTFAGAAVAGGVAAALLYVAPEDAEPIPGNVQPSIISAGW